MRENIKITLVTFIISFLYTLFFLTSVDKMNIQTYNNFKQEVQLIQEEKYLLSSTIEEQSDIISEQDILIKNLSFQQNVMSNRLSDLQSQVAYLESCYEYSIVPGTLTKSLGVAWFEGHKETYYNLSMDNIIKIARNKLPKEQQDWEYTVREDGAKMYGDYIIVAANQNIYPYGSIVMTSLGEGIVLDTGSFVYSNPYQIDLALDW